jgi:hypothetical protein
MNNLILDIKIKIASNVIDTMGDVWYKMMLADDEFAKYARSNAGIQLFINLATVVDCIRSCKMCDDGYDGHNQHNIESNIHDERMKLCFYKLFGVPHRNHVDDLPAQISYLDDEIAHENWYNSGRLYRVGANKPVKISYDDGRIYHETYLVKRENSITWKDYTLDIEYDVSFEALFSKDKQNSREILSQIWRKNGILHRDDDLPAIIDGGCYQWFQDGLLHRNGDKPAYINGDDIRYYKMGQVHRDGGKAAVITKGFYPPAKSYYYRGKYYTPIRFIVARILSGAIYGVIHCECIKAVVFMIQRYFNTDRYYLLCSILYFPTILPVMRISEMYDFSHELRKPIKYIINTWNKLLKVITWWK